MKLLIASDEPIVRHGLRDLARVREGWTVGAEAGDAKALLEVLAGQTFDVAVLTVPLGEHDGIDLIEQIRAHTARLPVIVLSSHSIQHYAVSFLRAGANAFLRRDAEVDDIAAAIDAVAGGGKYISPALAAELARSVGPELTRQLHERLSGRELEVFRLLAAGHSPTTIGAMLGVSVKTVSTYRSRILEKTGFRSNAEIVGYAIRHRLV